MTSLKGKNCLITGATGGLGREIAIEMAREGCKLCLYGTSKEKLSKLRDDIINNTGNIHIRTIPCNFEDLDDMLMGFGVYVGNWFCTIDILINCAGVYESKKIDDYSRKEELERLFKINVLAPMMASYYFSHYMKAKKWGRIVNIGSIASYQGFPNNTLYCATKHALLGFSRALRGELKPFNVRVYCVSPSAIKTHMGKQIPDEKWDTFLNPEEVAKYINFIIKSDDELIVDEIRLNRFQV